MTQPPERFGQIAPSHWFRFSDEQWEQALVADLRWGMFLWQRMLRERDLKAFGRPHQFQVKELPRRHGKTYSDIHNMRDDLIKVKFRRPIGAYYCPDKGQALRNAWTVLQIALNPVPGVKFHLADDKITFPRPTIENPDDHVTIYIFGVRAGSGKKRGQYYDVVVFDEAEFMGIDFIEEVGFGSVMDRDGIVLITGTPWGRDVLDHFLRKGRAMEEFTKAVDSGKFQGEIPPDKTAHREWLTTAENCWTLKLYSKEKLEKYRSVMDPATFAREFECRNLDQTTGFYHREAMERARKAGNVSADVERDHRTPLRAYFDLGLGTKSDRMGFLVCQFALGGIEVLYGTSVLEKGYHQAALALMRAPHAREGFFEVVLPHDANASEQSDAVPKAVKFENALREAGCRFGAVRVMPRSKDKEMDMGLVSRLLPRIRFHSVHASEVVDALECHKRRYMEKERIYLQEPAKTKWRDLADAVRQMCVDWHERSYTEARMKDGGFVSAAVPGGGGSNPLLSGETPEGISVGMHPSKGSVIINADGSLKSEAYGRRGGTLPDRLDMGGF